MKFKSLLLKLAQMDCNSNSCLFGGRGRGGQRTNSGCTCIDKFLDENKCPDLAHVLQVVESCNTATSVFRFMGVSGQTVGTGQRVVEFIAKDEITAKLTLLWEAIQNG